MIFNRKKYRKGIFMVTYKFVRGKPKYLILKRKLHWKGFEFPKGGMEKSETSFETIKREIFEETGLPIKKIKNHNRSGKWKYNEDLKDRPGMIGQTWSLFSVEVGNGPIKIDKHEHSSFEWLSYEEALNKLTYENQKICLDIVNDWLKNESEEKTIW